MTHGLHGLTTLSKTSNHLGNLANVLKDLGGGGTLLHELAQNADDAKAKTIRFVATDAELTVWNSGEFTDCGAQREDDVVCPWHEAGGRSCDLHSFREFAGRHKSADSSTTGAFGVGFTSVYQITDHPELVASGWHITLDEAAPERDRITVCSGGCSRDHSTVGTTFYLPWARDDSRLRQALSVDSLTEDGIGSIVEALHGSAADSAIFLAHVSNLEVAGQGRSTKVTRKLEGGTIRLHFDGRIEEWLLLEGTAAGAEQLKADYDQIEPNREALVQIAVPLGTTQIGRIYAGLPTETRTGWTGHINGSFYPRQDRKGVEFGTTGFRARWNRMLVDGSAEVLAANLQLIAERLGYPTAWDYLAKVEVVNRETGQEKYPDCFTAFFSRAKQRVGATPIALLVDGRVSIPQGSVVPRDLEEYEAREALVALGIPLIHESIRSAVRQTSHTEYGIQILNTSGIVKALLAHDVYIAWKPPGSVFASDREVDSLLTLLQRLDQRGGRSRLVDAGANLAALVPCLDGSYARAQEVCRLEPDDRALFEMLDPTIKIVDEDRLSELCPSLLELCDDITIRRAIELFERDHDALEVAPIEILEWLDDHRADLHDPNVQARVRALPIFPSTTGELKPLTGLSLASTFKDRLGVAGVIDRDRVAGHEDLLRLLGARELDAIEYLTRHVVPISHDLALSRDQLVQVLETIYTARPQLDSNSTARALLTRAPLVHCTDGEARPATAVHGPNKALTLISPDAPVADLTGLSGHLSETLYWLGVSRAPNHRVLADAARRIARDEADPPHEVVLAILDALPDPLPEAVPQALSPLISEAWLPVEGGGRAAPANIFAVFRRYLFESQGWKLALPLPDQTSHAAALAWLGVQRTPTTAMVIAHLKYCAETGTHLNEQVYTVLGDAKEESQVQQLRRERCVQVRSGEFVEPDFVYWTDPGLGRWAHQLPHGHRQYQSFFDRVGANESPSPQQIEILLREIGRTIGNDVLDEHDQAVVHRCWELLDQQLARVEAQTVTVAVLERLGAIRSALDARGMLEKPQMLLFVDGRRLAEKIPLISNQLIRRDRTTQRALTAAGTRPAEDVIDTLVDLDVQTKPADSLGLLIDERTPAIRRLVEANRDEELAFDIGRLRDVDFIVVPDLVIKYRVRFAHREQTTEPEPAEAVYLEGTHQLVVRSQSPNRHLARELARCIEPGADVSVIAPSLHEILSAPTLGQAMDVLNDYGVRDLDESTHEHVPTALTDEHADTVEDPQTTTDESDDAEVEVEATHPDAEVQNHDHDGEADPSTSRSGGGGSANGDERPKARSSRRNTGQRRTHMASFVSFDDDDEHDIDQPGDEAPERSPVDAAGVLRVIQYEESCGRVPSTQPQNNPGFDVLSLQADGSVARWIEIKSIGGPWTGFGVWMSTKQLEENKLHGDDFWLYVVEHAEDADAFMIHRIQNPAGNATKFGFDDGWQALREPDIARDDSGHPLVNATRRFLRWGKESGPDDLARPREP